VVEPARRSGSEAEDDTDSDGKRELRTSNIEHRTLNVERRAVDHLHPRPSA
jgi:hypothetical protein